MIFNSIVNKIMPDRKYRTHPEAAIVACYFNPHNSPYRAKVFDLFYQSIKHLNHLIVECVIGNSEPELDESENIIRYHTQNLLWHKETLINKAIAQLPKQFKYIFWVDADVLFTNLNWMVEGVERLQSCNIIQPFEYCVHLDRDEIKPSFDLDRAISIDRYLPNRSNHKVWRSFCANFVDTRLWEDENYDKHGHVGFAWGARREILEAVPLYDRALIGGADHIIAHAAAGQIGHTCITKSFTDNIIEIDEWSWHFHGVTKGKIGYVKGNLYHLWHGDIHDRQYLQRIQDFTSQTVSITRRDDNGFFVTEDPNVDRYMRNYFRRREVPSSQNTPTSSSSSDDLDRSSTESISLEMLAGMELNSESAIDCDSSDDRIEYPNYCPNETFS
jgi:galactosyl transferase GMA12/MNN10 family